MIDEKPLATAVRAVSWRRRVRRWRARAIRVAVISWLRISFLVQQVVAPRAAERRALDVWCTLPAGSHRRHDLRPGPGEVVRLAARRGGDVVAEVWGDGPVVLLVHGWGGWRGQLGAFVSPLNDAGYRVVALDAPGHGEASAGMFGPRRGTLVEIVDAITAVNEEFGPVTGVVAHSLGTTATGLAARSGLGAERVVLVAPNDSLVALLDEFRRTLWLNSRTTASLRIALEDLIENPIDTVDLVQIASEDGLPAALVVHDRSDPETSHSTGAAVAGAWPGATMVSTDGLGHVRVLADKDVVSVAVEHLAART